MEATGKPQQLEGFKDILNIKRMITRGSPDEMPYFVLGNLQI